MPPLPSKRQAFSNAEKKHLCEWFNSEVQKSGERPHWKKTQKWFAETYSGKVISQSTISTILTKRSADLLEGPLLNPQQKKKREVVWPKLDAALFEWHIRMEKRIPISGLLLKEKARQFFPILYPDNHETPPKFSDGWLDTWKKRHGIKEHREFGESGSAECAEGEEEMAEIRRILREYDLEDTYNFDETGYYYRMQPDRRLCTEQLEGVKKDKMRITVGLTCNGTGTHKLQPWVIGTANKPHCFRYVNRSALGVVYRHNKTAWMTGIIMAEYLEWFDRRMKGRKVVLLIDNFSAHQLAMKCIDNTLKNTRVIWLPANTTSKWQPLDQGIINAWKTYTRRHFIRYLMRKVEKTPPGTELPNVNILQAIRWAVEAWNNDVKPSTIFNCFTKSTVKLFEPSYFPTISTPTAPAPTAPAPVAPASAYRVTSIPNLDAEDEAEIQFAQQEVQASLAVLEEKGHIREAADLEKFLNPEEERIEDDPDALEEHILNSFLTDDPVENAEIEREEIELPKVEAQDALKYLEYLEIFELQQESPDEKILGYLTRMRRDVEAKKIKNMGNQEQKKITVYFRSGQ